MKLNKIVKYVLAPIPTILTIIAIDYFIYYVIEKKAGQLEAITVTICITVLLISVIGYVLYDTKIKHRGESLSAFEYRQTAAMMKLQNSKRLLVFLFPLIFFVFLFVYRTALLLMLWLICLLIGGFGEQLTKIISWFIFGVSIFFSLGTCIWLWTTMKNMSPDKTKDNPKLT